MNACLCLTCQTSFCCEHWPKADILSDSLSTMIHSCNTYFAGSWIFCKPTGAIEWNTQRKNTAIVLDMPSLHIRNITLRVYLCCLANSIRKGLVWWWSLRAPPCNHLMTTVMQCNQISKPLDCIAAFSVLAALKTDVILTTRSAISGREFELSLMYRKCWSVLRKLFSAEINYPASCILRIVRALGGLLDKACSRWPEHFQPLLETHFCLRVQPTAKHVVVFVVVVVVVAVVVVVVDVVVVVVVVGIQQR